MADLVVSTPGASASPRGDQKGLDVLDRTPETALDHLRRHPRVVRSQHHVREREQLVAGRNRFFVKTSSAAPAIRESRSA